MKKPLRRTFGGIQFTYMKDGYSRPGDKLPHWVSASGIKLLCLTASHPLDPNWEISTPQGRNSGLTAVDAMQNAGLLPRP